MSTPAATAKATEADKLHLIMQVADEVARKYRIEPESLWGVGWEAVAVAERTWKPSGPILAYMRVFIVRLMTREAATPRGRRSRILTGSG
jgi:hypothetical protein